MNGKEKDDEISGAGNDYDFGARMYDARLGRTLSLDPHAMSYPGLSPYSMFNNNPIIYIDKDGKDFDYAVTDIKNKDGSITRVVNISVVYKVVNLSNKQLSGGEFNNAEAALSKGLDYNSLDAKYLKGVKNVQINVDVSFQIENDPSKISNNDNILLIVDKVKNGEKGNTAGWGDNPGNVAIVEAEHIDPNNLNKFASLVAHEVGHNLSLDHDNSDGNVMNESGIKNTTFGEGQKKEFDQYYAPGMKTGKGHVGDGNSKANAQSMLRSKGESYNTRKAEKIR